MKFSDLTLDTVLMIAKVYWFQLFNFYKYKKLGTRAYVIKPLRLDGRQYMSLGKNVRVQTYSWLIAIKIDEHEPELTIGEGCALGDFNHIAAVRRVVFGKNVLTANGVYVSDNLHGFENITVPIMHQPVKFKAEVHVGDGTWIGENVCIIGASIGKNCVIGANSVVTKDVPDYCVAVGSPAKIIKKYNPSSKQWANV